MHCYTLWAYDHFRFATTACSYTEMVFLATVIYYDRFPEELLQIMGSYCNCLFAGWLERKSCNIYKWIKEFAMSWLDNNGCSLEACLWCSKHKSHADWYWHIWPRKMPILSRTFCYCCYYWWREAFKQCWHSGRGESLHILLINTFLSLRHSVAKLHMVY